MINKSLVTGTIAALGALYAQPSLVTEGGSVNAFSKEVLQVSQSSKDKLETFFGGIKQMSAAEAIDNLQANNLKDFVTNAEANGYDVQVIEMA